MTDTATIADVAGLPTPTGTVTFFLCEPPASDCASGGDQVGAVKTLVNGVATSDAVTGATRPNDLAGGQYCWRAVYSGDSVYSPASHTDSSAECFTVGNLIEVCKSPGSVQRQHPLPAG